MQLQLQLSHRFSNFALRSATAVFASRICDRSAALVYGFSFPETASLSPMISSSPGYDYFRVRTVVETELDP